MAKYVIGATGALLGALVGAWLMLAPFALAYQGSGADWADPTYVDFWTGLPLTVISIVGLISISLLALILFVAFALRDAARDVERKGATGTDEG
jgi:hypothetical protein